MTRAHADLGLFSLQLCRVGELSREEGGGAQDPQGARVSAQPRVPARPHPGHEPGAPGDTMENVAPRPGRRAVVDPRGLMGDGPQGEAHRYVAPAAVSLQRRTAQEARDGQGHHAQ